MSKVGMVRCSQTHLILKDLKIQIQSVIDVKGYRKIKIAPTGTPKLKQRQRLVVKLIKNTKTQERSVNENKTSTWPLERNPAKDFWEL